MKTTITKFFKKITEGLTVKHVLFIMAGAAIYSFGIHNIHQRVDITEGGVIGLMLLAEHWLGFSPALITPVLDVACYLLAFRYLGKKFIRTSILSTACVSLCYGIWERFPFLLPDLSDHPLAAALLGGAFVGTGVGIIVRQGGSSGGDDALALAISRISHCRLSKAYLVTDITVLLLSLSYIPLQRIAFSLITVTVSSLLIDRIADFHSTSDPAPSHNRRSRNSDTGLPD